jgi:glycosyltransferase involved in cell wall biosynthesis
MRWLIVEEALRDRKGHWFEAISTFYQGFRGMGDEVVVVADAAVQPDIRDSLAIVPILPTSIWHRTGDGSGQLTRYSRVFTHSWQIWRTMRRYLKVNSEFDAIFVPSVGLHHLLAWFWLIKTMPRNRPTRLLLFFLILPVGWNPDSGEAIPDGSPTSRLFFLLLKWLEPEVRSERVMLGAEVEPVRAALESLSGVPATLFPQIVIPLATTGSTHQPPRDGIKMACYGPSRAEKGSDVLQEAIEIFRRRFPASQTRFTIHWTEDFVIDGVRKVTRSRDLLGDTQVQYLTRLFTHAEYEEQLKQTDVMLLPYRLTSYRLRGSRVVMEAVVNGMPVIATRGTALAEVVESYGAGLFCEDGDPESLAIAIREMEERYDEFKQAAEARTAAAAREFSVESFRHTFLKSSPDVRVSSPSEATSVIG